MLFAGPYIPFEIMQLVLIVLLVNGVLCFFALDRFVARVDPRTRKTVEKRKDVEIGPKSVSMQNLTNGNGSDSGTPVPSPAPTPPPKGPISFGAVSP